MALRHFSGAHKPQVRLLRKAKPALIRPECSFYWYRHFHFSLVLHKDWSLGAIWSAPSLRSLSLHCFAPWFLLTIRLAAWAEGHFGNAVAHLLFSNEGTVGKGLGPLVTRGAGIRTWVLALSGACLSRMTSNISGWVPENPPCAWCFRVPRVLSLVSSWSI